MELSELKALHEDGHDETANIRFADMCRDELYREHELPEDASHLVHYTTLGALMSMLGVHGRGDEDYRMATPVAKTLVDEHRGSAGYLRLYDTFSSNDPNEGAFFVRSADEAGIFRDNFSAVMKLFKDRSVAPAYQTSLTYVENAGEADNLVFWRTYGREGTGCAVALPRMCFEAQANLYRVKYGELAVAECLHTLFTFLEAYSGIPGAPNFPKMSRVSELPTSLVKVLSPLVYLYKSEAYAYEKEVRFVVPYSDLQNSLYLQGSSISGKPLAWRHFAEVPGLKVTELLVSGARIILGPTVDSAANVRFVLERLLRERGFYGPTVVLSTIAYRR